MTKQRYQPATNTGLVFRFILFYILDSNMLVYVRVCIPFTSDRQMNTPCLLPGNRTNVLLLPTRTKAILAKQIP